MATKILGMTALTKLVDKTKKYVNDKKMINVMNDSSASGNYSVVLGGQGTVPGVCSVSLGGYSNAVNGCLLYTSPSPRDVEESRNTSTY